MNNLIVQDLTKVFNNPNWVVNLATGINIKGGTALPADVFDRILSFKTYNVGITVNPVTDKDWWKEWQGKPDDSLPRNAYGEKGFLERDMDLEIGDVLVIVFGLAQKDVIKSIALELESAGYTS